MKMNGEVLVICPKCKEEYPIADGFCYHCRDREAEIRMQEIVERSENY